MYLFSGNTATQPTTPPTKAMNKDSNRNDRTTLSSPKPSARMAAISRVRSVTAEYMVFRAANTAPMPMTAATMEPSTTISVVRLRDWFS